MRSALLASLVALAACANGGDSGSGDDDGRIDAPLGDAAPGDGNPGDGGTGGDAGDGADAAGADATGPDAATPDAAAGVITGGPCLSGAPGAAAYRIQWADGGGTAYVVYEVNGLPDPSRDHAGAYGYQIGFTPSFVDPYLGDGGLLLDSSDFVDLELSTVGVSQITAARLSIFGRSFNTTASGSFHWQTFDGTGSSPIDLVSNVAPYAWYTADMTTELSPGDDGVLIRIEAGPSSGSLVVNRIELCLEAS